MRFLALLPTIVLLACGGDAAPDAEAAAARPAEPVEANLVSDDPTVRQRLSPGQLLTYFPDAVGSREATIGPRYLRDVASEDGSSWVSVRYRDYDDPGSVVIEVEVADFVDDPPSRDYQRSIVEDAESIDTYGTGEIGDLRTVDGGLGRTYTMEGGMPHLYLMLADRFYVTFRGDTNDDRVTTEGLWEMYEASGLSALAGAPVYAEAGAPDVPAWAAGAVAEWETASAAEAAAPPEEAEPVAAVPSCDVVLPVAEVERVCGVSGLRASPTSFETVGSNCNRIYSRPGESSGLILIVSRYGDARTAQSGQRVAVDTDNQRDRRDVPGLGDAATRYVHDLSTLGYDNHVLAVAAGTDLIEMKSEDRQDEPGQQVCSLDQMETLARGVVGRLRN